MRLNAKTLKNVANVNQWEYASEIHVQEGQTNDIYIQLIDQNKAHGSDCPMRYMSTATVIAVEVTFPSLDDDEVITKAAVQPFSQDKSIWKITLASTETPQSGAISVKLTEDAVDKFFTTPAVIQVDLLNDGGC